jgi:hypothetical protein
MIKINDNSLMYNVLFHFNHVNRALWEKYMTNYWFTCYLMCKYRSLIVNKSWLITSTASTCILVLIRAHNVSSGRRKCAHNRIVRWRVVLNSRKDLWFCVTLLTSQVHVLKIAVNANFPPLQPIHKNTDMLFQTCIVFKTNNEACRP